MSRHERLLSTLLDHADTAAQGGCPWGYAALRLLGQLVPRRRAYDYSELW